MITIILAEMEDTRFQRMLDITSHISEKDRNEYGKSKSNVMTNSNRKNRQRTLFKLGNMELKETDNYKYLVVHLDKCAE